MHIALCGPITPDILYPNLIIPDDAPTRWHPYPFAAYLAKQYLKLGHQVSCITTCPNLNEIKEWDGENIKLIAIPRRKTLPQMLDVYRAEVHGLCDTLREIKPDIIHAQWTYEYADAALSSGFPVLVTARDAPWRVVWTMRSILRLERALYCQSRILPRVQYLSTISPYMAKTLKRQCLYPRDIQMIPNGIPLKNISPFPKKELPNKTAPVICSVSGWGRMKNLISSLLAFQKLRDLLPDARLILFGSGLGPGELAENYCKKNGLLTGVEFQGYQSQDLIRKVLREKVDIVLHTSLEESFGMTILDGMAQGIPCLGGESSGATPWLLDQGKCGILTNVLSTRSILESLLNLINNPETYQHYAQAAHKRALKVFTIEDVADKYISMFKQIT